MFCEHIQRTGTKCQLAPSTKLTTTVQKIKPQIRQLTAYQARKPAKWTMASWNTQALTKIPCQTDFLTCHLDDRLQVLSLHKCWPPKIIDGTTDICARSRGNPIGCDRITRTLNHWSVSSAFKQQKQAEKKWKQLKNQRKRNESKFSFHVPCKSPACNKNLQRGRTAAKAVHFSHHR